MKKKLLIIIIISCFHFSYSQNITGFVKDSLQNPVILANVQIEQNNKFTQTDANGYFSLKVENLNFPVIIKVSHLSFEKKEISTENFEPLKIILQSKTNNLKEVILSSKSYDVIEKKDTIKYNLKQLLNGSEVKLKDVLEKLPGISIDDNGKIRYNGKQVNNLLIDGDEFFKDNHQLATENLTAEMIEKIEVLKNYQKFSTVNGFESSGVTALNVGLNDKFKNIFKGNSENELGYKKQYKTHNNFFNFGKKIKFNLLTDLNNTNYSVISVTDYIALKKNIGKKIIGETNSSGLILENELPPFLFSNDDAKTKDLKNYTLNYTNKINSKKRIEFVSIFNKLNILQETNKVQTFFQENSPNILKTEKNDGSSLFFSNTFTFENKIDKNSFFNLNAYLLYSKNKQTDNLLNSFATFQNSFLNSNKIDNILIGYNTSFKKKISEKTLFETIFFNDFESNSNNRNINSNETLSQFNIFSNNLEQNTNYSIFSLGIKSTLTFKRKKGSYTINFKSIFDNENLNNYSLENLQYNFDTRFYKTNNSLAFKYNYTSNEKFKYNLGLDFINYNYNVSNKLNQTVNDILPNINLTYKFNSKLSATLGYNATINNPSIYNFLDGDIVQDYRTILIANTLINEKLKSKNIQFNLSYTNSKSNIFSILNIVSTTNNKVIGKNFTNSNLLTLEKFDYLNTDKSTFSLFVFDKKFYSVPYGVNIESLNSISTKNTIVNNINSTNNSSQNKINLGYKSYFKSNDFNFNIGVEYLNSVTKNNYFNTENEFQRISPTLKLNGVVLEDKVNWNINSNYYSYKTSSLINNNIFDLGFKISYRKNNIDYYIKGNNILNIRQNNIKNSINYNQVYVEEILLNSLSGYINLGLNFSF
ncbi:TonB-dependent receptor [Flavobacterium gelidilacus]|uniref:TonB-dependent receptor n=1 Tax=Flavobacterium gelidilacus TaxID=206041 RepID=UPI0004256661|nr:TonB-dependent receptor [Flavobacterium gelidilacus]